MTASGVSGTGVSGDTSATTSATVAVSAWPMAVVAGRPEGAAGVGHARGDGHVQGAG